jgi:hypothetical protein
MSMHMTRLGSEADPWLGTSIRRRPLLALFGPRAMSDLSPLSGAKRTICARSEYFAF